MGQGCSRCNAVDHHSDGIEPPDPVVRDLIRDSIRVTTCLREGAYRKRRNRMSTRAGESFRVVENNSLATTKCGGGQNHLLYKNSVVHDNRAPNVPPPQSSSFLRRGGKIAESFESEKRNNVAAAAADGEETHGEDEIGSSSSYWDYSNTIGEDEDGANIGKKKSEEEMLEFETSVSKMISSKCPTKLLVRRRIYSDFNNDHSKKDAGGMDSYYTYDVVDNYIEDSKDQITKDRGEKNPQQIHIYAIRYPNEDVLGDSGHGDLNSQGTGIEIIAATIPPVNCSKTTGETIKNKSGERDAISVIPTATSYSSS